MPCKTPNTHKAYGSPQVRRRISVPPVRPNKDRHQLSVTVHLDRAEVSCYCTVHAQPLHCNYQTCIDCSGHIVGNRSWKRSKYRSMHLSSLCKPDYLSVVTLAICLPLYVPASIQRLHGRHTHRLRCSVACAVSVNSVMYSAQRNRLPLGSKLNEVCATLQANTMYSSMPLGAISFNKCESLPPNLAQENDMGRASDVRSVKASCKSSPFVVKFIGYIW